MGWSIGNNLNSNNMPAWIPAAIAGATSLIGQGIARGKDERQIRQQEKLQGLQMRGNKEMMQFANDMQMEMWERTGYGPQKEQMKAAGLNPALMYGMGGGGAQTIGNNSAIGVSGGQAPSGSGREAEEFAGMGIQMATQLALLKAQKENIESDTELNKVEANKRGGVDTELGKTQIASLTQGIENQKAIEVLTKIQGRIASIDEWVKGKTQQDQVELITWKAGQALEELSILHRQNLIDNQTMDDKVSIVKTELAQKALQNALIKATTITEKGKPALQQESIKVNEQQIKTMIQQGIQRWKDLEIQGNRTNTEQKRQEQDAWINDVSQSTKLPVDVIKGIAQAIIFKSVTPGESFEDVYQSTDGETTTRRTYRQTR